MKLLTKILLGAVVLLALGFGGLLLFLNPIVNKFKPEINKTISSIVKQDATIGDISLSLFPKIGINVGDVSIQNNGKTVASLKKLFLHTGLNKLIKGDLSVDTFSISDANLNLLKDAEGTILLGQFPLTQKTQSAPAPTKVESNQQANSNSNTVTFNLKNIDLNGLNLTFLDNSKSPAAEYKIQNFAVKASDIGNSSEGSFTINGKIIEAELYLKGKINLGKNVKIESLTLTSGGQKINLNADLDQSNGIKALANISSESLSLQEFINGLMPAMAEKAKGIKLTGLNLDTNFSAQEHIANTKIKLTGAELLGSQLISNLGFNINAKLKDDNSPDTIKLEKSSLEMFKGKVELDAEVKNLNQVTANILASAMDLSLISKFAMPNSSIGLEGSLSRADIKSNLNTNDPKNSIKADVNIIAEKGAITGFNIVKETLGKLNVIPGLEAALLSFIPEKYSSLINGTGTQFDKFTLNNSLSGANVNISNMSLDHALYKITGQGNASATGTFKINAKLILTPTLAAGMTSKQDKLKYLSEADGSIVIPLIIEKTGSTPIVLPDAEDLLKRAAKNSVKDAGMKALEKVAPGLDKVAPGIGKALESLF